MSWWAFQSSKPSIAAKTMKLPMKYWPRRVLNTGFREMREVAIVGQVADTIPAGITPA